MDHVIPIVWIARGVSLSVGRDIYRRTRGGLTVPRFVILGAGVVELADTGDLKSPDWQQSCGFETRLRQISSFLAKNKISIDNGHRVVYRLIYGNNEKN